MVKRPRPINRLEGHVKVNVPNPVPVAGSGPAFTCLALHEDFTTANGFVWIAQHEADPIGYCPVSYREGPDGTIIRIETRQDAIWPEDAGRGVERAEVDGSDGAQRWEVSDAWSCDFYFTLTTGVPNTGSEWMSIAQIKNSSEGPNGEVNAFFISPALILSLLEGEELVIEMRTTTDLNPGYEIPPRTIIWTEPVQRGHRYHVQMAGRFDPLGINSFLEISIDDVEVYNEVAFPFGYYNQFNYFKLGLYRDAGSSSTQTCEYENFTYSITPLAVVPGAEALAYIAEQPSPPTAGYERMIAKFINGLADTTLFAKGIAGYICGVEGEAGAYVNIFDPTGTLASMDGSVVHTSPYGWKSGGGLINTNIAAQSTSWTQNSGCMALVTMDTDLEVGVWGPQMGDRYFANNMARLDYWCQSRLNAGSNSYPTNNGDVPGTMITNRVSGSEIRVLMGNNLAETVSIASNSFWDDNPDNWFLICGASAERSPTAVGAALWFEGLTPTEETQLQSLLLELFDDLTDLI